MNIDVYWEEPLFAGWLRKLAAFARVITFDKLARACLTGSNSCRPWINVWTRGDGRGWFEASGCVRSLGGRLAGDLVCRSIIPNDVKPSYSGELLLSSASGFLIYKTGRLNAFFDYVEKDWGTGANIGVWAPTKKDDPAFQEWLAKRERVSASRAAVTTLMRMNSMIEKWHKQPLKGPRS